MKKEKRFSNLIFDLDGTLTDSGEGITKSVRYAYERMGLQAPELEKLKTFVGPPLAYSFAKYGLPEERIDEAIALYRDRYNNQGGKFENYVYEGIQELLEALRKEGFSLYVATSKPEGMAREIMDKFGLTPYFAYIAGATSDHNRESKSDVLRYLQNKIGDISQMLMIGDTIFDVEGAGELGIPCLGVSWGYGDTDAMLRGGAIGIAENGQQVLDFLLS